MPANLDMAGRQDRLRQVLFDYATNEFRQLPEEWQLEALQEVRRLQRFSRLRVRFVGDEEDQSIGQAKDNPA